MSFLFLSKLFLLNKHLFFIYFPSIKKVLFTLFDDLLVAFITKTVITMFTVHDPFIVQNQSGTLILQIHGQFLEFGSLL